MDILDEDKKVIKELNLNKKDHENENHSDLEDDVEMEDSVIATSEYSHSVRNMTVAGTSLVEESEQIRKLNKSIHFNEDIFGSNDAIENETFEMDVD